MSPGTRYDFDVIIVGAGPVGLSLGLGLVRSGKSVLVLEKKTELSAHSRAPAIWPRTQEILADLGVEEEFLRQGIRVTDARLWDADADRELLHIPIKELTDITHFPWLLILPQEKTERILLEALRKMPSADVRFSTDFIGFEQSSESVTVTFHEAGETRTARSRFVVGCDGAHSRVREILGFSLEGITYPLNIALADIRLTKEGDLQFPRFSTNGLLAAGIRIEKDLWRLILFVRQNEKLTLDERIDRSTRQLFGQPARETVWQSEFKLHQRVSTGFGKNRVVLAGDAAHLNSPVGGQGMNAGIQDTEALKAVLLSAIDSNDPSRLGTYMDERRHEVRIGVNRFTNQLTRVLLLGQGNHLKSVLKIAGVVLRMKKLRRKLLLRAAMLPERRAPEMAP